MKVLYVSDSLGTPIHPRGIHNFSMSLIEIFQEMGAQVDLLVERPRGVWLDRQVKSDKFRLGAAFRSIHLSEIYRSFAEKRYSTAFIFKRRQRNYLSRWFVQIAGYLQVARWRLTINRSRYVTNDMNSVDFIPEGTRHLTLPNGFVVRPFIYTEMILRALFHLPAPTVDASGYDLVIVDTPTFVRVEGIEPRRILSVIHDIIPLRDPFMAADWRYLFMRKLYGTLALRSHIVFVSEYTRSIFRQSFPKHQPAGEAVINPCLRKSVIVTAEAAVRMPARPYAPLELSNLETEIRLQNALAAGGSLHDDRADSVLDFYSRLASRNVEDDWADAERRRATPTRSAKLDEAYSRLGWDTRLPYFVTVVSDEPRKNIGLIVKAFRSLKGQANMVIVGQVEGKRYLGDEARFLGHIRFTGYVPEAEKHRIISAATGLIFASFTEGFGIPITEGAVFGKPVLCSDIDVFREVAGGDAFYFDPYKEESLVEAIQEVLGDPEQARARATRLKQLVLQRFSHEAMATQLTTFLAENDLLK